MVILPIKHLEAISLVSMNHQRLISRGCWVCLLTLIFLTSIISADTLPEEAAALHSLAESWENQPQSWVGLDPCGTNWVGISCSNSHIIIITLPGLGLGGTLSAEIQNLPELVALDLSYNEGLNGPIPQSIGNLVKLRYLVLVGCSFSGNIPPELGNLARLSFL
uniref:Probable leucine-rich repeat receptor-like protein kinase At5g49770 n=2 Tax=Elaeis guineensis var. tenera TaxID=51953 RepID=A0A8N4F0M7_ELAGV|nr:probable leucine-rich repeat receptor-like protein kinase At5g49770 [Elaeis guineensis]